jgi:hypothetical protein
LEITGYFKSQIDQSGVMKIEKRRLVLILAVAIVLSLLACYKWLSTEKSNALGTKLFYESDVYGDLTNVQKRPGGFVDIELKNGKAFTFHPLGNFEQVVKPGDSISKPAFFFEIFIFKSDSTYSFTFITPSVSQLR